MAIFSYTDISGIKFNNITTGFSPKKEIPGKLVSNQNDFAYADDDGIKYVVNSVEIDWNGAIVSGQELNTTGEVLSRYKIAI